MKLRFLAAVAAIAAAAAAETRAEQQGSAAADPVVGNWGLKLPYGHMYAGHMIVSRDGGGKAKAFVLWRWASPADAKSCKLDGPAFTIKTHAGVTLKGKVVRDSMSGVAVETKSGKEIGKFTGWRNPPSDPSASTKKARFGKPVDLLADGLDGWVNMNPKAKFGWKFENGVLSNCLGRRPDGRWAGGGANIMTKRADFTDFKLEYDVRVPEKSNSGVYLRGRYEIQVFDSFGQKPSRQNMCALYGRIAPSVAAEKPAGEWQHVCVVLYKRRLSVTLNGVTIIDDQPVGGPTGGAIDAVETVPGPIYLQGDHSDADFRNMFLSPALD